MLWIFNQVEKIETIFYKAIVLFYHYLYIHVEEDGYASQHLFSGRER